MLPYSDRKRAMLWLQEALVTAEESSVLSPVLAIHLRQVIRLEWSSRMDRTIGKALYSRRKDRATLRLSTILWEAATEEEKRETVFHELAHLVVDVTMTHDPIRAKLRSRRHSHHGKDWRRVMDAIGYPDASRCHEVWNERHERSKGNLPLFCGCQATTIAWVPLKRAQLLASTSSPYHCQKCKTSYRLRA